MPYVSSFQNILILLWSVYVMRFPPPYRIWSVFPWSGMYSSASWVMNVVSLSVCLCSNFSLVQWCRCHQEEQPTPCLPPLSCWYCCSCTTSRSVIRSSWDPGEKKEGGDVSFQWEQLPAQNTWNQHNKGLGLGTGTNSMGKEGTQCSRLLKLLLKTCVSKDIPRTLGIKVVET